jgi:hypothetical protein
MEVKGSILRTFQSRQVKLLITNNSFYIVQRATAHYTTPFGWRWRVAYEVLPKADKRKIDFSYTYKRFPCRLYVWILEFPYGEQVIQDGASKSPCFCFLKWNTMLINISKRFFVFLANSIPNAPLIFQLFLETVELRHVQDGRLKVKMMISRIFFKP